MKMVDFQGRMYSSGAARETIFGQKNAGSLFDYRIKELLFAYREEQVGDMIETMGAYQFASECS